MTKDIILKSELQKIFDEGWVKEENVKMILKLADINLLYSKNPENLWNKFLWIIKKEANLLSYQREDVEAQIFVDKTQEIENLAITLNYCEKAHLQYDMSSIRRCKVNFQYKKDFKINVYGEDKFTRTEIQIYYKDQFENINIEGDFGQNNDALNEYFFEILKVIHNKKEIKDILFKIKKYFKNNRIEIKHKNISGEYVLIENLYNTEIIEIKNRSFLIKKIKYLKNNTIDWEVKFLGDYYLEIKDSIIKLKIKKNNKNYKLHLIIKDLKNKDRYIYYTEDSNQIEIVLDRTKMSGHIKKIVDKIEKHGKEIWEKKYENLKSSL